ncbi:MAG: MFS transporter [Luteolibacter sp.]
MTTNEPSATDSGPIFTPSFLLKCLCLLLFCTGAGFLAAKKLELGNVAGGVISLSLAGVGIFSLMKLRGAPREMGITFGLKFLSVTAYKILNFTLVMWLLKDLGYAETGASSLIVGWSLFMTCATIVAGPLTDALGLRRTLFIGVTLCVLTRLVMVFCGVKWIALAAGLMPLAIGEALCTPVLVAAIRRYSKPSQRTVAFSLFYALMNFGFMFGYFISDAVKSSVTENATYSLPVLNIALSQHSLLIFVSLIFDLLMIPLISFLKSGVQMTETGFTTLQEGHEHKEGTLAQRLALTVKDAFVDTGNSLGKLVRSDGFTKLIIFLLMIGLLKLVFNIMDYVLTPFANREIGPEAAARVGRLNATNSIMILVLAPAVGMMTRKFSSYSMVIVGGFITALSFVFMAMPTSTFQGLADGWLGKIIGHDYLGIIGDVHPYYIMIFLWQIAFSVGEAFYSPRVYEYAASISPPGQEASYSSLSYVPLLVGKLSVGAMFAGLLTKYCPETGPRDSPTMWLIVGLMVLVAPVALLAMQRFIRVKEEGRDS